MNRIKWVDISKGIGIVIVVLGHCLDIDKMPFHLIFTFHMPLFFILSGYVFKSGNDFRTFFCTKVKSLVVPYFIFFTFGFIVTLLIPAWREELTLMGIRQDLWLADPNSVHNSSIWFLICLFIVQILFWILEKLHIYIQIIILFVMYNIGIWYSVSRPVLWGYSRLPFDLDVVPIAITFFAVGHYLKKFDVFILFRNKKNTYLIAAIFSALGVLVIYKNNGYVNLHGLTFGNPLFYFMGAISGSLFIICIANMIQNANNKLVTYIESFFTFYGKNSLIILGVQSLLIRVYIVVLGKYGVELFLYRFSLKHTFFCSGLILIICCPVICLIVNRLILKTVKISESI